MKREIEGCTFKPKINVVKTSRDVIPSRPRTPLYNAQALRDRKEILKQKKLEQEVVGCTFKPKITTRLTTPETKATKTTTTAVHDRLLETEARRMEKLEKLRQEQALKEKEAMPFVPQTSSSARRQKKETSVDLYDRLYRSGNKADKVTRLEHEKMEKEMAKCSFKPEISKSVMGKGKQQLKQERSMAVSDNIFDRLFKESTTKLEVVEQREQQRLELEVQNCTFAPQVDTNSRISSSSSSVQPIWERLYAKNDEGILKQEQEKSRNRETLRKQRSASTRDIFDRMSSNKEQVCLTHHRSVGSIENHSNNPNLLT